MGVVGGELVLCVCVQTDNKTCFACHCKTFFHIPFFSDDHDDDDDYGG